jgi:hypothetical protein
MGRSAGSYGNDCSGQGTQSFLERGVLIVYVVQTRQGLGEGLLAYSLDQRCTGGQLRVGYLNAQHNVCTALCSPSHTYICVYIYIAIEETCSTDRVRLPTGPLVSLATTMDPTLMR